MDHYYSKKPTTKSEQQTWETFVEDESFSFVTDTGVFSKNKLDTGSEVLMTTAGKMKYPKGDLLDIGCGYGPVGLYLARKFPDRQVEMVDINERALALAAENAKRNQIDNVSIYQSDLFMEVKNKKFAGIFSNPPIRAGKQVVHEILEESYDYLIEGGALQIVIQKKQGAPSAREKMKEVFGNVERIALEKGYWILESRRRTK